MNKLFFIFLFLIVCILFVGCSTRTSFNDCKFECYDQNKCCGGICFPETSKCSENISVKCYNECRGVK